MWSAATEITQQNLSLIAILFSVGNGNANGEEGDDFTQNNGTQRERERERERDVSHGEVNWAALPIGALLHPHLEGETEMKYFIDMLFFVGIQNLYILRFTTPWTKVQPQIPHRSPVVV